jgi:hypothetical protein
MTFSSVGNEDGFSGGFVAPGSVGLLSQPYNFRQFEIPLIIRSLQVFLDQIGISYTALQRLVKIEVYANKDCEVF